MVYFTEKDVVRHDLVTKIIKAYEVYTMKQTKQPLWVIETTPIKVVSSEG